MTDFTRTSNETISAEDALGAAGLGFTRLASSTITALDSFGQVPDNAYLPRQVYIKHLNKIVNKPGVRPFSPAIALQFRDWSNSRTQGLLTPTGPTDGATPVFRAGTTTPVLSEVFASWTDAPRGIIAYHMNLGQLEVHEDYLGTSRILSSGQVMQYTPRDQPWSTFIDHRTGLTAADSGAPADYPDGPAGTLALAFNRVIIRPQFTGGTNPTVTYTVWAREALPDQPRGVWGVVGSASTVGDKVETTFITGYREVYVQVTAVAGSPTSFVLQISGTSAS